MSKKNFGGGIGAVKSKQNSQNPGSQSNPLKVKDAAKIFSDARNQGALHVGNREFAAVDMKSMFAKSGLNIDAKSMQLDREKLDGIKKQKILEEKSLAA